MFQKERFKELLVHAIGERTTTQFALESGVNRTYLSKYINLRLDSPPSPDIIRRIAKVAHNNITYNQLMIAAGHLDDKFGFRENNPYFRKKVNSLLGTYLLDERFLEQLAKAKRISVNDAKKLILYVIDKEYIDIFKLEFITDDELIDKLKESMISDSGPIENNIASVYFDECLKTLCMTRKTYVENIPILEKLKWCIKIDKNLLEKVKDNQDYSRLIYETYAPYLFEQTDKIIDYGYYAEIPVYGSIPAGIPIDAIEDIEAYVDIPLKWIHEGKKYIALKVKGDSMYPDYLEGDIVIIQLQPDCESGQDCAVYINGYEVTLKTVIKEKDRIILKPINPLYPPKTYYNKDDVTILGVVKELRRKKF